MAKWIVLGLDRYQSKPDEKTGEVRVYLKVWAVKPTPSGEQGKSGLHPQLLVVDPSLDGAFLRTPAIYDLDLEPHKIWVEKKQVDSLKVGSADFISDIEIKPLAAPAVAAK